MSVLNNSLLLGQEGGAGYVVERSLRFSSIDSAYLSRTPASAGNRKTWTWAAWVKRSGFAAFNSLFGSYDGSTGSTYFSLIFTTSDTLRVEDISTVYRETTQVFRDPSAWYHVVLAVDTTAGTASNRVRLYVNGAEVTAFNTSNNPTLSADLGVNGTHAHGIGRPGAQAAYYFNGYLADIHLIDGQALTPSSFTEVDASTGQLVPKAYSGSFGTNGFWLKFSDNSAATATTLGKDYSGNNNNWTPNNLSVTAGAGNDSLTDTPTSYGTDTGAGGEVRGNYCTMNPLDTASGAPLTLTNGNLEHANPSTNWRWRRATFAMTTGKWYWEQTVTTGATGSAGYLAGAATAAFDFNAGTAGLYARQSGTQYNNGTTTNSVFPSTTAGDILGFAFDADAGKLWVSQNGTFVGSPTAGTGNSWSNVPSGVFPLFAAYNVAGNIMNFGARSFAYTAPSGFKALVDTNIPVVIAKPSTVFDVKTYSGNGGTQSITGLAFSPDLVWYKSRNNVGNHALFDSVRGATKRLVSNDTAAEDTRSGVTSFDSTGWTEGSFDNQSGYTYVAWTWDAGSSTVTNNSGSISSQVRANTSAGFSIVTFTSNASGNATVGHGLGVAPSLVILKNRTGGAGNWLVFHKAVCTKDNFLYLNSTNALGTYTDVQGAAIPSSTVFGINAGIGITGSADCVAYVFSPVAGYSSMGSYVGNGSSDGVFQWCGFRPRFLLIKRTDTTGSWVMLDAARDPTNVLSPYLLAESSGAEDSAGAFDWLDFTANGFKQRNTGAWHNASGGTYVWAAFAESPFQYARAR